MGVVILVWHPKTPTVPPPPTAVVFWFQMVQDIVLFDLGHVPRKKSYPPTLHGPKSEMASKRLVWSDQLFFYGR